MKLLFILLAAALLAGSISAAVPQTIVYQGRLTDDGAPVADGLYLIQFRIYDAPADGAVLWDNSYRTVLVTDGLFEYHLGDSTALPDNLFTDTGRWLGMKVGAAPEMSPRMPLASYAYAYHALRADTAYAIAGDPYVDETGDTMTGTLTFHEASGNQLVGRLHVSDVYHCSILDLYDADVSTTVPRSRLYGDGWGTLALGNGNNYQTASLDATTVGGGQLSLRNSTGGTGIVLNGGSTGDNSVAFPDNAVNEDELLNEPGLATAYTAAYTLTSTAALDSIEVTAPTSGYVFLVASGYFYTAHTSGSGDEVLRTSVCTARNGLDVANFALTKVQSAAPTGDYFCPFSISCVKSVAAGTTEFFFTADVFSGDGYIRDAHFTALFFPTAYGSVEITKSSSRVSQTPDGSDLPAPETYDARPLIEAERTAQFEQQRLETEAQSGDARRSEDRH